LVGIIAVFADIHEAVAADFSAAAVGAAAIAAVSISIVTDLSWVNHSIATEAFRAAIAAIAVDGISIIAGLSCIDNGIATFIELAGLVAAISDKVVSIIAGLSGVEEAITATWAECAGEEEAASGEYREKKEQRSSHGSLPCTWMVKSVLFLEKMGMTEKRRLSCVLASR
jgi:hypothetical protein